jgi:hypothetical protein
MMSETLLDRLVAHARDWFFRGLSLLNKSALLLILPAFALLYWLMPSAVLTIVQWAVYVPIFAGVAVIVSLLAFPQVKAQELISQVASGNVASAIVLVALMAFYATIFVSLLIGFGCNDSECRKGAPAVACRGAAGCLACRASAPACANVSAD